MWARTGLRRMARAFATLPSTSPRIATLRRSLPIAVCSIRRLSTRSKQAMRILGIETSCDETAAAIVEAGADGARPWQLRSSVVASQVDVHREWGGVVPELASRQHVRDICGVVERALADGGAGWHDVDAIAVTQGPGLVGSLLVGEIGRAHV